VLVFVAHLFYFMSHILREEKREVYLLVCFKRRKTSAALFCGWINNPGMEGFTNFAVALFERRADSCDDSIATKPTKLNRKQSFQSLLQIFRVIYCVTYARLTLPRREEFRAHATEELGLSLQRTFTTRDGDIISASNKSASK